MAQLAKSEKSGDPLLKEIRELTNELKAIVEEGEMVWWAGEFSGLKPMIEEVARRSAGAAK
jgi:hypothetical protein